MKFGFVLPAGNARTAADTAALAEQAGWDGFFVWEPVWGHDAWVLLTAAAMVTNRIRLGTLLSPISRMRPWKLAGEAATLDNLSSGRVIISTGLGAIDSGFTAFGEETDRRIRAELLDEGLEIMTGLWQGQPFSYQGKHYQIQPSGFMEPERPIQQPRIPIWVVGAWPRPKSMQRVLKYDGLLPYTTDDNGQHKPLTHAEVSAMSEFVAANRTQSTPFDIIIEGVSPGDRPGEAADITREWAAAGGTWWIESMWDALSDTDGSTRVQKRIEQGPPRFE